MYICIISRGYPTDQYKMNGIFEYDQAKALAQAGQKVVMAVIDLRSFRRKRKWGLERLSKDGVEIYALNIPVGRCPLPLFNRIGMWALRRLSRIIEREQGKPDILHSHFTDISCIASDWAKRERIPFVVTEHNSQMNEEVIPPSLIKEAKLAYQSADRVIAVGRPLAEKIQHISGISAAVIGNVVDARQFADNGSPSPESGEFRFVSTGSLIPRKRMDLLLECFAAFHKAHPDSSLTIFGDGPMKPALQQYIAENRLEACVRLMGLCSREQMVAAYKTGSAFVLPSRTETFGVAYIEAMAAGLPVIATRCGGPEDFVTKENGVLIPVDDKNALVDAMEYMLLHHASYDKQRISDGILAQFSPDAIAAELIGVYQPLLETHREDSL